MTEKTIKKTYGVTNTIKTYIAEDGKEFSDMSECVTYEKELFFNRYADKYKIKFIEIASFICDDDYVHGISFYFPQDGDKNELTRLLSIYQNYVIDKDCDKWKIKYDRNLSNVRDSDFEIKMPSLTKGETYIFYFCWERYSDDWDIFYNKVFSKEMALTRLNEELKAFEEIFGTKFEG